MPEQRVERPTLPVANGDGYEWRRYALQLERDLATVTAERDRLRKAASAALLLIEINDDYLHQPSVMKLRDNLRAALTPPAERPDPATKPTEISDGFGGVWVKCDHPKCDLHVVRPGKSDCSGYCTGRVPAEEGSE